MAGKLDQEANILLKQINFFITRGDKRPTSLNLINNGLKKQTGTSV